MKTLTGQPVDVDVGYERFLGPEMFFHPVSDIIFLTLFLGIPSPRLQEPS